MYFGTYIISMVKTNAKLYLLVLNRKSMMTGYSPLIATGYKYNTHKVIYCIATEYAGITKSDITYLSKSIPTHFLMFIFSLLLVLLSCLSSLDMLMRLTPKKNLESMI